MPSKPRARAGKCQVCGKEFRAVSDYSTNNGGRRQKYCSKECWSIRSRVVNECGYCGKEIITTKSQNKKFCNNECRNNDYKNRTKKDASAWKGDEASYSAIHKWVNRHYEKPGKCEHCGKPKIIEWANVSGEYNRKRDDWIGLCKSCHFYYDGHDKTFIRYK